MLGLRTRENEKFNRFWQLIQNEAHKVECTFFGFAGEGRDFETPDMEGEDFSGWLVPLNDANAFEQLWLSCSDDAQKLEQEFPSSKFVFAIWHKNADNVSVEFKEF